MDGEEDEGGVCGCWEEYVCGGECEYIKERRVKCIGRKRKGG